MSEPIQNKMTLEGTLVGRNSENVQISMKGRKVNIPRQQVTEVRLPKSKNEPSDKEIKKLL